MGTCKMVTVVGVLILLPGIASLTLYDVFHVHTLEEVCELLNFNVNCTCDDTAMQQVFFNYKNKKYFICDLAEGVPVNSTNPPTTKEDVTPTPTKMDNHTVDKLGLSQVALEIIAVILSLLGNSLVVAVYFMRLTSRTNHDRLIMILAVCDMGFAVLQLILIIPHLHTEDWIYGEGACKVFSTFLTTGANLAIGIILIISIERYIGIVFPFSKRLSSRMVGVFLLINFLVALFTAAPRLVVLQLRNRQCVERWPEQQRDSLIYSCFLLIFYCLLPLIVISFLYWRCILALKSHTKNDVSPESLRKDKKLSYHRRVMNILIALLLAFFILTFPNKLRWVIFDAVGITNLNADFLRGMAYFGNVTYPFHVAVNPFIYSCIDKKFRQKVMDLFRGRGCGKTVRTLPLAIKMTGLTIRRPGKTGFSIHKNEPTVTDDIKHSYCNDVKDDEH